MERQIARLKPFSLAPKAAAPGSLAGSLTLDSAFREPAAEGDVHDILLDTLAPLRRPLSDHLPANGQSGAEVRDWGDVLLTVKTRLRQTVHAQLASTPDKPPNALSDRVQASVLECVEALDQLHAAVKHERGRCRQLELNLFYAQTALAQARAQLVGTQAGERRARHLAQHDSLTELPNRGCFHERLDHTLTHAALGHQTLAVLYLDLDGFKAINDTHDHEAGDELLRIVGARLQRAVRSEDMVSRLSGDEFACLLAELPPGRGPVVRLASVLFDTVSAPIKIGKLKLSVHPSIGIAICPADGNNAETLLRNADTAMCRAKRQQTGYEFFDQCPAA